MEPSFYIVGPIGEHAEPTYWNVDQGWVEDFNDATPLTADILTQPLPPGVSCLILHPTEQGIIQLDPIEERGAQKIFVKTY